MVTHVAVSTDERWLVMRYHPSSLFSLRMTHATSKGGKTLLVPTPYAVKLAFIDAGFRAFEPDVALEKTNEAYELLKGRRIRFRPPEHCLIQHTFVKVKQEERDAPKGIYAPTIAYREFCFYSGNLEVAMDVTGLSDQNVQLVMKLARRINYLGKRGSFMQYLRADIHEGALPRGYTCPEDEADIVNGGYGTTHYLDEFGEALIEDPEGFARIDTYGAKTPSLGRYRVLVRTLIPYRYQTSARHFTHYRRTDID